MKKLLPSALLLACAAVGGCDLPLDAPVWETSWTLPGTDDTVATAELLPDGVTMADPGFIVAPLTTTAGVSIGQACPLCTCYQGPIPQITLEPVEWPLPLPSGLTQATLTRGQAHMVLHNGIPFDLLDDGQGNTGFLTIRLMDRLTRTALDSVKIQGSLPPGDSVDAHFDLSGLELSRYLVAQVAGTIPGSGCDTISLDPSDGIRSDLSLSDLEASDVTVLVSDAALALASRSLELPQALDDRLRPDDARLELDLQVESSVPLDMELLLSVAARREDLFGPGAALFTPILVERPSGPDPTTVQKLFLLDLTKLQGADSIFIDTRNSVQGSRAALIQGGESVRYTATLHADLPSR